MSEERQDSGTLDPVQLVKRGFVIARRTLRFWPVLVGATLIAVAAALVTPKLIPPIYTSQSTLVYRELIRKNLLDRDAPVESSRQRATRLKELLLSRTNLAAIIEDLDLYADTVESLGMLEAVEDMRTDTRVKVGEDTFSITYEAHDPQVAHDVTKRLSESLIAQTAKYRLDQAESTKGFLEEQAKRVKEELHEREQEMAEFLSIHPEFAQDVATPGRTAGASIRAQERASKGTDPAIEALKRQRARLMARLDNADEPADQVATDTNALELDPKIREVVDRAQRRVEDAQRRLAEARSRYTDKHPDVKAAESRLASAQQALRAAQQQAKANLAKKRGNRSSAPAAPAAVDEDRLQRQLATVEKNLKRAREKKESGVLDENAQESSNWIVDLETEWSSLNRELEQTRERHQQIQHRHFQASIMAKVEASGGGAQMDIVDPAFVPKRPNERGPRRTAAAGAFVVLLLGCLIAFALAYFDDRLYDERDLEKLSIGRLSHIVPKG